MQAPAPGGAQTITVLAPQYPGYGLRDPNDCGECNPCALFINFFVVLLLGFLGMSGSKSEPPLGDEGDGSAILLHLYLFVSSSFY
jgi:hypothetical protein